MGEPGKRGLGGLLRNWWGRKNEEDYDEELLSLVNDYKDQGAIEEDEAEMISNIMEFSETRGGRRNRGRCFLRNNRPFLRNRHFVFRRFRRPG